MTDVQSPIPTPRPLAGRRTEIPFSGDPQRGCTPRAGLIVRRPGGVEAEEGDPSFPEVFVGATPFLDHWLRKTHLCRGIIAWRAILSDESDESDGSDGANDTGCVLSPSRLARNDPGGASRKGLPSRVPLPGCPILHKGAWRTGLGSSWLGSANSFTGIRFF